MVRNGSLRDRLSDLVVTCASRDYDVGIIYVCQNIHDRRLHASRGKVHRSLRYCPCRIKSAATLVPERARKRGAFVLRITKRHYLALDRSTTCPLAFVDEIAGKEKGRGRKGRRGERGDPKRIRRALRVCVRRTERTGYVETLISRGGNIGPMIFEARVLYETVSLVRGVCV